MKKYDEYKDSGVAWIGEVPKHWEVCKLKHYSQVFGRIGFRGYNQTDLVNEGEGAITLSPSNMQNGILNYDKCSYLSWKKYYESPEIMIYNDDVLFVKTGSTYGKISYVADLPMEATINPQIVVFKNIKGNNKYLYYLLSNDIVQMQVSLTVGGSTIPTLSQESILNYIVPLAPKVEQTAIATYLDTHCAKIDNLISIQQKRIALLQELKQSVITHAVTKGLNPNVKMKQSGVEWIGAVPKHWELVRTRYLCNLCTGSKDTINRVDDGKYPFYVRSPKVERIDTYSFDGEAILMAGDGVGAGKVFHYAVGKFDYHQRVYNFHNFKHVLGKFFYNYISNNFKYIIEEGGAKNTVDSVRLYMIQNFMTTVPPLEEQMEICNYIEQKEKVFDTSISNAQHQIELLQEYKQSLITEVVTGKRKVTDN